MRMAIVQVYDLIDGDDGDLGFLVLEKFPEGGVRVVKDYRFNTNRMSIHNIIDILSLKLYDKGFEKILLENTRNGQITPFDAIRSARSKDINKFRYQLQKEFHFKKEHARLFSDKIFSDKDSEPYSRINPREEYDRERNALFMHDPETYSKMLRKKKKSTIPKTKRKIKKVIKKKKGCGCK